MYFTIAPFSLPTPIFLTVWPLAAGYARRILDALKSKRKYTGNGRKSESLRKHPKKEQELAGTISGIQRSKESYLWQRRLRKTRIDCMNMWVWKV